MTEQNAKGKGQVEMKADDLLWQPLKDSAKRRTVLLVWKINQQFTV